MKIAEALLERSDLQKRLAQIDNRLMLSAVVQGGNTPPENPKEIVDEMNRLYEKLETLVQRLQKTNATTNLPSHGMLSDALAKRDLLLQKRQKLEMLAEQASHADSRYSMSEIRTIATVNVRDIRKQIDDISKEYRELDTKIQQANWLTELV